MIGSTAWLRVAPIGIDVNVTHGPPNPNTHAKGDCEGVQDIHKVCIIWRQSPVDVHVFKHGSCGIQACGKESQDGLSQKHQGIES